MSPPSWHEPVRSAVGQELVDRALGHRLIVLAMRSASRPSR